MTHLKMAPLGREVAYPEHYDPSLLFPIARQQQRETFGLGEKFPFIGNDLWYAYELSWLNARGKPEVAIAELLVPSDSPFLIESKSMKLYLNSLSGSAFPSLDKVRETLINDIAKAAGVSISVDIQLLSRISYPAQLRHFSGECLDNLDVSCDTYHLNPDFLQCSSEEIVSEVLYSDLLKSHCLKTGQPDWGSVCISYTGKAIDKPNLLKYIVSFRNHQGFAEDCTEQIFTHIMERCEPELLTVEVRYTRRGGIDINPLRSNAQTLPQRDRARLWRS